MAVKANQEKLHAAIVEHFEQLHEDDFKNNVCRRRQTKEKGSKPYPQGPRAGQFCVAQTFRHNPHQAGHFARKYQEKTKKSRLEQSSTRKHRQANDLACGCPAPAPAPAPDDTLQETEASYCRVGKLSNLQKCCAETPVIIPINNNTV